MARVWEGRNECMRLVAINVSGLDDEEKRREKIESFVNGRMDVLGVSEMHIRGTGLIADVWEGVPSGVWWREYVRSE